jgi:serine protease Do
MTRPLLLGLLCLAACSPRLAGQPPEDRGKRLLPRLFVEPASHTTAATVRILCDGQDAALGAVVGTDGYILTKGTELRGTITCRLADGRRLPAKMIDYHRQTDLAMLKVDVTGLKAVEFADGAEIEGGMMVAATAVGGEPVAVGVIGAPARKLYGEEAIIANENRGKIGVFGLRDAESTDGVVVPEVDPGQAADRAGMKAGDILFEIAGKRVKDRDAALDALANRRRGERLSVRVRRGDRELALEVILGPFVIGDRFTQQQSMGGMLSGRRTGFPIVASHDASLRAIDCGGPLVDLDGNVLGLNIARAGRTETWMLPGKAIVPLLANMKAGKYGDWPGR